MVRNSTRHPCKRRHTSIERVLAELLSELHEVTLDEGDLILEAHLLRVLPGTLELEVVVVEADDVGVAELGNLASGATDTATDVEHTHARSEDHLRGKVMLMTSKGREESLALVEAREMERLGPTVLVHVGRTVIVT